MPDVDAVLQMMATLGLPIHITELDVNSAQGGQRTTGADGEPLLDIQDHLIAAMGQRRAVER